MMEYNKLVELVLREGVRKPSRTGVDTISYFGAFYKVDLAKGFPLLTGKTVNFNACLRELLWYLSGDNHIRNLQKHTKIWDAWADANGDLETAYGYYWRHFPSPYGSMLNPRASEAATSVGDVIDHVDQIQFVIDELKRNPMSRRLVVVAWEPGNAIKSKLPPCHYTFAFNVTPGFDGWRCRCGQEVNYSIPLALGGGPAHCGIPMRHVEMRSKLNCHLTQRSGDIALGIPFNLACYATLTQMIAQEVGMEVGEFAHTIIDAHIYTAKADGSMAEYDHVPGLGEQLTRPLRPLPRLTIAKKPFSELTFEDFAVVDYNPHPPIKFKVAV